MAVKPHAVFNLTHKKLTQIHGLLIKNPKPHILNPLLGSLSNSPTPENAFLLYNQMLLNPASHNHYTFTHALKACFSLPAHQKGLEIHAHVLKYGHYSDIFIQNSLLHFYVIVNDIVSACQVFDSISFPDVVSWTSFISGLSKCGFEEEAIVKFSSMDVEPNSTTLVSVISACSSIGAFKLGKAIHGFNMRKLCQTNIVLDNAMLDFYVRCGSLVSARYIFENMPKRDVVSWTTIVGGYAHRGFCEDAVRLFNEMVHGGEAEPNEATIVNVLSACSSTGALSLGQWVHSYIATRDDLTMNGNVGNAFINMYVKCGNICMAIQVFNTMTSKDIISWSTTITGMAMNGHGMHALQLFSLMLVHGVPPDDVTFIGLLSACSHGGMVERGLMIFNAMKDVYQIVPEMQHYACVVDMYGRAGLLEEAEAFIREMPMEAEGPIWGALLNACKIHSNQKMFERMKDVYQIVPEMQHYACVVDMYGRAGLLEEAEAFIREMPMEAEGPIWGALLNACKIHSNQKMFERIKHCLLKSKGVGSGTLALLSNTYASSDRWDDANKVRDEMRWMGLKKMTGCSWIEADQPTNIR